MAEAPWSSVAADDGARRGDELVACVGIADFAREQYGVILDVARAERAAGCDPLARDSQTTSSPNGPTVSMNVRSSSSHSSTRIGNTCDLLLMARS